MQMSDPRHIAQVFDPRNINHIRAHEHLERTGGTWPADLDPALANADFEGPWQLAIKIKVLEHYKQALDSMISQAKGDQMLVKDDRAKSRYSHCDDDLNYRDRHSIQILGELEGYLGFDP